MLYSEFIRGTGCKETPHNYRVYKDLEVMYLNSNISKAEIYEYGKKLVDNSKTEAELEAEAKIEAEIKMLKSDNELCKEHIKNRKYEIEREKEWLREEWNKEWIKYIKNSLKWYREDIRQYKDRIKSNNAKIRTLKTLLG